MARPKNADGQRTRLAILDAQAKNFATSFVVVSDNDLRFHQFDDVYRKVITLKWVLSHDK